MAPPDRVLVHWSDPHETKKAPGEPGAFSVGLLHTYSKLSRHVIGAPEVLIDKARRSARSRATGAVVANRARQLRPDEVDALVAWYEENGSVNATAHEFQITRQTVAKHLASRGIETTRRMSATDISLAAERYLQGDSAATIGRQLGFAPHTVLAALRGAGVTVRARPGRSDCSNATT